MSAPSGVADQPFGDEETLLGAQNRVRNLYSMPDRAAATLLVSIEGGLTRYVWADPAATSPGGGSQEPTLQDLECFAWVVVKDARSGTESNARTGSFLLPRRLSEMVLQEGLELGDADDRMFRRTKSGQGSGTIGHLTRGQITRTDFYIHAIELALVPWMQPEHYASMGFQPLE